MSRLKTTVNDLEKKCFHKTYKMVPPEGGWGYIMCIGFILVFVPCFAFKSCFGMIFNGFLEDLGEGIGGFSGVNGLHSCMINMSGIFTNILLKKMSLRKVGCIGGVLYIIGMLANCFVTSVNQMILTTGILQGMGCGLLITIGFTSFNQYFVRRRLMMMSVTKIFCALGVAVYPMLMKICMQEYGWRGTNFIATAIDLNLFLGIALMHPAKWHQIKEECTVVKLQSEDQLSNDKTYTNVKDDKEDDREIFVQEESKKLIFNNDTLYDSEQSQKIQKNESSVQEQKEYDQKNEHSLSIIVDTKKIQKSPLEIVAVTKSSKWDIIVKYLDLDLLKDKIFINIAFGMAIGMNTETTFYMLFPLYLFFIKMSIEDVALCLSIAMGGDFISRIAISISSGIFEFSSRSLFLFGLVGSIICKLIFINIYNRIEIIIFCGIMGFFRGCMHIPISLVYAEYSTERFTAAYGLGHILSALCSIFITPIFGMLKDYTGNYTAAFYLNTGLGLLCLIPWLIEFWYMNNKNKRNTD